jgi:hypothetical protein
MDYIILQIFIHLHYRINNHVRSIKSNIFTLIFSGWPVLSWRGSTLTYKYVNYWKLLDSEIIHIDWFMINHIWTHILILLAIIVMFQLELDLDKKRKVLKQLLYTVNHLVAHLCSVKLQTGSGMGTRGVQNTPIFCMN